MTARQDTAVFPDRGDEWPAGGASRPAEDDAVEERSRDGGAASGIRGQTASDEIFSLVYRQMRSIAGGRPDFDDLVQIAAEQAVRSVSSFAGRSKLSTWTYKICYVTVLRHERWYRRWLRRFTFTERGELELQVPMPEATSLEQFERAARLRRALDRVAPKRRTVVVLHDLEEHSVEEIAGIVGANPLTVRSRLRDGRRQLARFLNADPYFGDEACLTEGVER